MYLLKGSRIREYHQQNLWILGAPERETVEISYAHNWIEPGLAARPGDGRLVLLTLGLVVQVSRDQDLTVEFHLERHNAPRSALSVKFDARTAVILGMSWGGEAGGSAEELAREWERRAELARRGGAGEARTGDLLAPLAAYGWVALHDRRPPGRKANIDHLVVGPGGIWVLDSKAYSNDVTHGNGRLWTARHPLDKQLGFVTDMATLVRSRLPAELANVPVRSALVIHDSRVRGGGLIEHAGVVVVEAHRLPGMLQQATAAVPPPAVQTLAQHLRANFPSATGTEAAGPPSVPPPAEPSRRPAASPPWPASAPARPSPPIASPSPPASPAPAPRRSRPTRSAASPWGRYRPPITPPRRAPAPRRRRRSGDSNGVALAKAAVGIVGLLVLMSAGPALIGSDAFTDFSRWVGSQMAPNHTQDRTHRVESPAASPAPGGPGSTGPTALSATYRCDGPGTGWVERVEWAGIAPDAPVQLFRSSQPEGPWAPMVASAGWAERTGVAPGELAFHRLEYGVMSTGEPLYAMSMGTAPEAPC